MAEALQVPALGADAFLANAVGGIATGVPLPVKPTSFEADSLGAAAFGASALLSPSTLVTPPTPPVPDGWSSIVRTSAVWVLVPRDT